MLRQPTVALLLPFGNALTCASGPQRAARPYPSNGSVATDMLDVETNCVAESELDPYRALALAAAGGDRRAASDLMRMMLPRMRNLVRYFVKGDSDVDDIAQEAMVNVLRGLPSYRAEGAVKSWADRIVVRTVFAHIRRSRASQQRHVQYTPDLAPVDNDGSAANFMARRRAVKALDDVPSEQREVLVLHHVLGLGVREISEELTLPFETVRSRLRLGMARLRNALGDDEPEAMSS